MMMRNVAAIVLVLALIDWECDAAAVAAPATQPVVVALLEDNAEELLPLLTNVLELGGDGGVEKSVVYSGQSSMKITPMQKAQNRIPGWNFQVVEKPGLNEYRYLRFAWRAEACAGIMLQIHDGVDWTMRYYAGQNAGGWPAKSVAEQPPKEWTVVTRDLYQDFRARPITGMAFTVFGGAGYFDHVYLGRSVEDLDRVDATGLRSGKPVKLGEAELTEAWKNLAGPDAPKAYLALWTLVADPKNAVPFIKRQLGPAADDSTQKQIKQWIAELDDERYQVRERASMELGGQFAAAEAMLRRELQGKPSPEVKLRIERLLNNPPVRAQRVVEAFRVLEYMDGPEATQCLQELANLGAGSRLAEPARAALERRRSSGGR